ncbi:hypothetical protein [Thioalkalivibrio sp. ALE11]|uniref:hypothetical protein n=1 Tax=Thioalkalivibrio sp. ALE11 TaxID=1265494 RepID=UPI00037A142A|nr:hypothetical protein [Thioalkalivibrio sp. ALE11]
MDYPSACLAVLLGIALSGCAVAPTFGSNVPSPGQPLIRDADGRITGYIDEQPPGPTYIRGADGRILGTVEDGPGSAPTRVRDTDGRIRYEIDELR